MSYPGDENAPDAADMFSRACAMVAATPQAAALGIELTALENGVARGRTRYRPDLVGDPESGILAGGVITTMLDQLSGVAAVVAMREPTTVATIDLRIDYMRAAEPGRDVLAEAKAIRVTRSVVFVHAVAYEESVDNPIAHAAAAFMITGKRKKT